MEKENKKEKIQSRREFFKDAARKGLPIIAAIALAGTPLITKAESEPMNHQDACLCSDSCYYGCYNTCRTGCTGTCSSCNGRCAADCVNTCTGGCDRSCFGVCRTTCYGECTGQNYMS